MMNAVLEHRVITDKTRRMPPGGALFLDRDGVIIADSGHVRSPESVMLLPTARELVARANSLGIAVIVVTNQSGIGRGLFDWEDFDRVSARIAALLGQARIDAVLACGTMPPAGRRPDFRNDWRKPACGMLLAARDRLGIDLARSWLIGDRYSDLRAARRAGLAGAMLVSGAKRPLRRHERHDFTVLTTSRLADGLALPELIAAERRLAVAA